MVSIVTTAIKASRTVLASPLMCLPFAKDWSSRRARTRLEPPIVAAETLRRTPPHLDADGHVANPFRHVVACPVRRSRKLDLRSDRQAVIAAERQRGTIRTSGQVNAINIWQNTISASRSRGAL